MHDSSERPPPAQRRDAPSRAVAGFAAAGLALLPVNVVLAVASPRSALRDARLDFTEQACLIATEWLAEHAVLAPLALVALLASALARARARPALAAARWATGAFVAAAMLVLLLAWGTFSSLGSFPDADVLAFARASPLQLVKHVLAMTPALLVAAVGASAAAGLAAGRIARAAGRRTVIAWVALLASSAVLAAIGDLGDAGRFSPTVLATSGLVSYHETRAERTGPVLHVLLGDRSQDLRIPGTERARTLDCTPLVSAADWARGAPPDAPRYDVIVLLVESLRPDVLRSFGGTRDVMPSLDALAARSLRFTRAYSQATHSDYADLCPLSSQYPLREPRHHFYANPTYPRVLLHDLLKARGYRTAVISSQNETWNGMSSFLDNGGFDLFFHSESAPELARTAVEDTGFSSWTRRLGRAGKLEDRTTVERAIGWIAESDRPLFLYLNLQASHFPYHLEPGFPPRFAPADLDFPITFGAYPPAKTPVMLNRYHNTLAYVDAQVGRLLDALRASGRMDRTILVVSGDTGQAFGEHGVRAHGGAPWEEVVRVPLIVSAPGLAPAVFDDPVQHVDVPPTVLGLLELPPFTGFQGRDVLNDGPAPAVYLVAQTPLAHQVGIVSGGYKLVYDVRRGQTSLHDLRADPGEQRDLSESQPARRAALAQQLQTWVDAQLDYYASTARHASCFAPRPPEPRHAAAVLR